MSGNAPGSRPEIADALFGPRLAEALGSPEFRIAVIQRLVAATLDAKEGGRVVDDAVGRVWEARGTRFDMASRLVREVDAGCARYADIRGLPYRKVVRPIIRNWPALMLAAREAGLTEEEGYAVMRDLLRKIPPSHWSKVKDINRGVLEEMKMGFQVVGLGKRAGLFPGAS